MDAITLVAVTFPAMQLQWRIGVLFQDIALMNSSIDQFFHLRIVPNARSSQIWKIYRAVYILSANRRMPSCALSLRVSKVWQITSLTVCSRLIQMKNSRRSEMRKSSQLPATHSFNLLWMIQSYKAWMQVISPTSTFKELDSMVLILVRCKQNSEITTELASINQEYLAIVSRIYPLYSCKM